MIVHAAPLLLAALALAFAPHPRPALHSAAERFADQAGYNRTVLSGMATARTLMPYPPELGGGTASDVLTGVSSAACPLVLAGLALYARRLQRLAGVLRPAMPLIRRLEHPERRGQRLRHVGHRRRRLHRRSARVHDPLADGRRRRWA